MANVMDAKQPRKPPPVPPKPAGIELGDINVAGSSNGDAPVLAIASKFSARSGSTPRKASGGGGDIGGAGGGPAGGAVRRRASLWERVKRPTVREALLISYASIVLTVITSITGFVLAVTFKSAATLGYALDSFVDIISSVIVVWRFYGDGSNGAGDAARLALREKRASVGIAFTFVLLCVIVTVNASGHLADKKGPENAGALLGICVPSVFFLGALGLGKIHFARCLGSPALKKDGVCSLAAALMSFCIAVSIIIYASDPMAWWIDAVCAIFIGLGLGLYGLRTLVKNRWWTRAFWEPTELNKTQRDFHEAEAEAAAGTHVFAAAAGPGGESQLAAV